MCRSQFSNFVRSPDYTDWNHRYYDCHQCYGGFICSGEVEKSGQTKLFVSNYTFDGTLENIVVFDSSQFFSYKSHGITCSNENGGFAITGDSSHPIPNSIFIVKVSSTAGSKKIIEWQKNFRNGNTTGHYVIQEGNYLYVCGSVKSTNGLMMKLHQENGSEVWNYQYLNGSNEYLEIYDMFLENDGSSIIFTGKGKTSDDHSFLPFLGKIDGMTGNVTWIKTYNFSTTTTTHHHNINDNLWSRSVSNTTDGGYLICGEIDNDDDNTQQQDDDDEIKPQFFVIKTNQTGDVLWIKIFNINDPKFENIKSFDGIDAIGLENGGLLVIGEMNSERSVIIHLKNETTTENIIIGQTFPITEEKVIINRLQKLQSYDNDNNNNTQIISSIVGCGSWFFHGSEQGFVMNFLELFEEEEEESSISTCFDEFIDIHIEMIEPTIIFMNDITHLMNPQEFIFEKEGLVIPEDDDDDSTLLVHDTCASCYGYSIHSLESCSGHGKCIDQDTCECDKNYYGLTCNITTCQDVFSNVTEFSGTELIYYCSGHGKCVDFEICECYSDYYDEICSTTTCFEIFSNETTTTTSVCSGWGECIVHDICSCYTNYYGEFCNITTCNNILSNQSSISDSDSDEKIICNGNGECVSYETCDCDVGYYPTSSCEKVTVCGDILGTDIETVCSGNGECVYIGADEVFLCFCDDPETYDFTLFCQEYEVQKSNDWIIAVSSSLSSVFFICLIISCLSFYSFIFILIILFISSLPFIFCFGGVCCCCFGTFSCCFCNFFYRKKGLTKEQEYYLKEMEVEKKMLSEDPNLAHLEINSSLFKIELDEIKLLNRIGSGGSNATIYKADFKGTIVAYKGFNTSDLCSSQHTFDEFEKEVSILSSISHPNTLRFYGAILQVPRVGIVMEYCPNGDLVAYYKKFNEDHHMDISFPQKLIHLKEIACAMEFLHSRNIIHRDLKPENVLIDEHYHCKVMDFGCSKLVERMTAEKTRRIGTSTFMAPEIVVGGGIYDEKVDCFSFSVMTFAILTSNFVPYGEGEFAVEIKVANDKNFRPNLNELEEKYNKNNKINIEWIKKMIVKCWDYDPSERLSFEEIYELISSHIICDDDDDDEINFKQYKINKKKKKKKKEKNEEEIEIIHQTQQQQQQQQQIMINGKKKEEEEETTETETDDNIDNESSVSSDQEEEEEKKTTIDESSSSNNDDDGDEKLTSSEEEEEESLEEEEKYCNSSDDN